MIKKYSFILSLVILSATQVLAQEFLKPVKNYTLKNQIGEIPKNVIHYEFSYVELVNKLANNDGVELKIPVIGSSKTIVLNKINILTPDYTLYSSSGKVDVSPARFAFYHGEVKGDDGSIATLMIDGEYMHLSISDNDGNFEVNSIEKSLYAGYYSEDILNKTAQDWSCLLVDEGESKVEDNYEKTLTATAECITVFLEVDHNMYNKKGSIASAESWAMNLMNQVAIMYMEHDVPINISGIQVWDTPDPYVGATNTNQALSLFRTEVQNNPNFNGRLAHLLSGRGLGGGIAYLNVLCSNSANVAVSANLSSGIVSYPTYSWNVMVVAHEMGHNVGSNHTHACVWNGNNTAIDGCATTQGNCPQPPSPYAQGGTVMSYCHLNSAGINLANGFGPQPGALIKDRYENASCETGTNCSFVTPFNDLCSRAKEINVFNYCLEGIYNNNAATASGDGGAMSCGDTGTEEDVWYKFDYPSVDTIRIDFQGVSGGLVDLVLEVYNGSCSSLASILCDSTDNGGVGTMEIYDPALVGQTLFLRVVDKGSDEEGEFSLCIYSEDVPCQLMLDTMVNIYNATNGASWITKTGWQDGALGTACDYCNWYGVECNALGEVVEIDLSSNNLDGSMPVDFQGLENLITLELQGNILTDTIPNYWDSLSNLVFLDLSNNDFSGSIPISFKTMTKINKVHLDFNSLSGPIPYGLGYNSTWRTFTASNNQLSGCFTNGVSSFCYRDSLNLDNNPLLPFGGDVTSLCGSGQGADFDQDGYCNGIDDCNDYDDQVNDGMAEVLCDGKDNNCDGDIDEGTDFGPNIWMGPDTLGNWADSLNWSLGHFPLLCENVEIGTNGNQITLHYDTSQWTTVINRSLVIGSNTTLVIDTLLSLRIMGSGNIENHGILILDGSIQVEDQDNTISTAIYNAGEIIVRTNGNINVNEVGEYGIHNTSSGIISFYGYSFIGAFNSNTAKSAVKNEGIIHVYGYFSIYGEFQEAVFRMLIGSDLELHNGSNVQINGGN